MYVNDEEDEMWGYVIYESDPIREEAEYIRRQEDPDYHPEEEQ